MATTLHVFESFSDTPPNVDADKGVIFGVKVAGSSSPSNRRTYGKGVLAAAVSLYEGVPVNIDHVKKPGESRKAESRFGTLEKVRAEGDSLFGDIHYLKTHPMASRIVEAAQTMPQAFGMSHDARAKSTVDGKGETVFEMLDVSSVDIVSKPGSTKSLFESEGDAMNEQPKPGPVLDITRDARLTTAQKNARIVNLLEEEMVSPLTTDPLFAPDTAAGGADLIAQAFESAVLSIIKDESLDVATKKKKIGELLMQEDKVKAILTDATAAPAEAEPTTPTPPTEEPVEESAKFLDGLGKRITESIEQGFAKLTPGKTVPKPRTTSKHMQEEANTTTPAVNFDDNAQAIAALTR